MSSKSSLFLTEDGDHWYLNCNNWNVNISIGQQDIVSMEYNDLEKTWFFEIAGHSELGKHIAKYRGTT